METYGLVIAGAAVAALLLILLQKKRYGINTGTVLLFGGLAFPLSVLISRAAFWICSIEWIKNSDISFWDFFGTGYSYMLYGAVIGAVGAAFLTAKISGRSFGTISDAAAAPAL